MHKTASFVLWNQLSQCENRLDCLWPGDVNYRSSNDSWLLMVWHRQSCHIHKTFNFLNCDGIWQPSIDGVMCVVKTLHIRHYHRVQSSTLMVVASSVWLEICCDKQAKFAKTAPIFNEKGFVCIFSRLVQCSLAYIEYGSRKHTKVLLLTPVTVRRLYSLYY